MTYRALLEPLLFAYPREFRQHYREQLFVDVQDALGTQSAGAKARTFLLRTALDIMAAGFLMRLEIPVRDIAFALRTLVRAPLFSIVAVLTLALAIGVNGAVFAVINAVLLKPLPFVQPERWRSFPPNRTSATRYRPRCSSSTAARATHSNSRPMTWKCRP